MPCNLALEAMGRNFSQVTFNGVAEKGAEPPPMKPPSKKGSSAQVSPSNNNEVDTQQHDCPHLDDDQDYEPKFASKEYFSRRAKACCSEKMLRRKLPIVNWLPRYTTADFIGDLIAGITVGFTIIPQGIAFAELAHLPVEYGLYSGFLGSFLYIFLGTVKEITIGPAAVICILLGGASASHDSQEYVVVYTVLLCLLSGLFCTTMGALKLGVVVEFISAPVIAGFVSAAAIVIIASQFKSILGLHGIHGEQLLTILPGVYSKLDETNYYDMTMGLVSIAVLIALQEMKNIRWERFVESPMTVKTISRAVWVFSAARNVLWILICCVSAAVMNHKSNRKLFTLTQSVRTSGIPLPSLPRFTLPAENVTMHNGEVKFVPEMKFLDILIEGGAAVFIIPLICLVEQIAVCKSFAKAKPVDVNQELTSLGIAQTLSAFLQSMPVTGSICRSAVNAVSGVRTPFGGLWSGIIVLCALQFCTPYLEYIPKAALGAIVICAVIHMIEVKETIHIWHTKSRDMLPLVVTFGSCLFIGLEWGFLIGVVVNILMLLFFAATPRVPILKFKLAEDKRVVILRPDRSLHYPGAEKVRSLLSKKALLNKDAMIVVDCVNLIDIDYTGAKGLGSVAAALQARNQKIVFVNVNPSIARALKGFTHGDVETHEFAQDWIDTLTNLKSRKFLHNSWSNPERAKVRPRPRLWSIGGLPLSATTTTVVRPDDIEEGGGTPCSTASSVTEGTGSAGDTDMEMEAEIEHEDGECDNSDFIDEHGVDIRL